MVTPNRRQSAAERGRLCFANTEHAMVGVPVGENETVRIPAEQAYEMHRPEMVIATPWQNLPQGIEPEVGQQL